MTKFIGKGIFKQYSQVIELGQPIEVSALTELLHLPKKYIENLIVVRGNQKLNDDELIHDEDEILIYLAVMGG